MNMVKFYKKRGKAIWKRKFISQRKTKCQKVADAFAELYEMADIVVVDVGRYGFVMLKNYMPPNGFEEDATFTGRALFEELWQEWFYMKLYLMAKGTPLMEQEGYKGVFESLTEEKRSELIGRKANFAQVAGISW